MVAIVVRAVFQFRQIKVWIGKCPKKEIIVLEIILSNGDKKKTSNDCHACADDIFLINFPVVTKISVLPRFKRKGQ